MLQGVWFLAAAHAVSAWSLPGHHRFSAQHCPLHGRHWSLGNVGSSACAASLYAPHSMTLHGARVPNTASLCCSGGADRAPRASRGGGLRSSWPARGGARPAREAGRGAGRKDAAQLDRELDDYYGNQVGVMQPAHAAVRSSVVTRRFLLAALTEAPSPATCCVTAVMPDHRFSLRHSWRLLHCHPAAFGCDMGTNRTRPA